MMHNCFVRCLTQKQMERVQSHSRVADWRPGVAEESRKLRAGVTRGGLPATASLQRLSAAYLLTDQVRWPRGRVCC
jgi:hypothetical protein